jgi:Leucine-rich repeat (LRR) protein
MSQSQEESKQETPSDQYQPPEVTSEEVKEEGAGLSENGEQLSLIGQSLTIIPPSITQAEKVKQLDLSYNSIT